MAKIFDEGEERLEQEMDILHYIKGMRTLRVLTSDRIAEMNEAIKMSDVNVIEVGKLKI